MTALLMTGFPGFLGSALLPRLLARRESVTATCLVQAQHKQLALDRVEQLAAQHPHTAGRITIVEGDIAAPGLGVDVTQRPSLADVSEVWHLAAVYDLSVPEEVARRVNVEGTARIIEFCTSRPTPARLHHVSTCYVSGDHAGRFAEDDLDLGQEFLNHYEATKFESEVLIRRAMRHGLRATVYRPGVVVGDSHTGATQKYDGPYYLARFLRRQGAVAIIPAVGDADEVRFGLAPRDYVVEAMDVLSHQPDSEGQTYALTDPDPPTARRLTETFAAHLGKRVVWIPMPLSLTRKAVGGIPGMQRIIGLPAEAIDYFAYRTVHDTSNTQAGLAGSGLTCPAFADYAGTLLDYMAAHPEINDAAMT